MDTEIPSFFIPGMEPEDAEAKYQEWAHEFGCVVLKPGKRIFEVRFKHDREEWIARVGENLRGKRPETRDRKGNIKEWSQSLSEPITVLAILRSIREFAVITNHNRQAGIYSEWTNPIRVGDDAEFTLFSGKSCEG